MVCACFAMREGDGKPKADCWSTATTERRRAGVRDYVGTWPLTGFEMRKQYVVLQTAEAGSQRA
jgi:hypothetical protein